MQRFPSGRLCPFRRLTCLSIEHAWFKMPLPSWPWCGLRRGLLHTGRMAHAAGLWDARVEGRCVWLAAQGPGNGLGNPSQVSITCFNKINKMKRFVWTATGWHFSGVIFDMYCFYFRGFKQHKITYRTERKIVFSGPVAR